MSKKHRDALRGTETVIAEGKDNNRKARRADASGRRRNLVKSIRKAARRLPGHRARSGKRCVVKVTQ